jgi:hypothetical protein
MIHGSTKIQCQEDSKSAHPTLQGAKKAFYSLHTLLTKQSMCQL